MLILILSNRKLLRHSYRINIVTLMTMNRMEITLHLLKTLIRYLIVRTVIAKRL
jgi:hypothetical protein